MKVLVTGASGFLGAALVARLLEHDGNDLRCLVRENSNKERLMAARKRAPNSSQVMTGSLASVAAAGAALGDADVVYHLVAAVHGTASQMYMNSIVTAKNLLQAVVHRDKPTKVVLVSSFGVYGASRLGPGDVLDERTPLESEPKRRDLYSQYKLRQELLFREYQQRYGFELVVVRPGVIYGPGGGETLSSRLGLSLGGVFLFLGGDNLLPLSYVDNCADAIAIAGHRSQAVGQAYNIHDDGLPTCRQYLEQYEANVAPLKKVSVPYPALLVGSTLLERAHRLSRGRVPAVFTTYRARTTWKGRRFSNQKLKGLGWQPRVTTAEGMQRTFASLRRP